MKANNRAKSKKFVIQFLGSVIVFALIVGLFIYTVDPLQFYHKEKLFTPKFSWQERYQNPGLAKNYDYDMIILGSSMTENFLPSEVGEKLDANVLKLSVEGSTAKEQYLTANVAFRTGQVQKVLWGLDYFAFRGNNVTDQGEFPYYLYDTNPLNDYKYLFNESNIRDAYYVIKQSDLRAANGTSLERLNNWDKTVKYGRDLVIQNWDSARYSETAYGDNEDPLEEVEKSFDDNVLSLVKAHPETTFYFYYPPYSILRQEVWYVTNPQRYANQLEMKRYMFDKLSAYPNVSIHEFQTDDDITYELDNYKDLSHHSGAINSLIADEIAKGTHLVTADNLESEILLLQRQAENVVVNKDEGTVFSIDLKLNGEPQSLGFIPPNEGDAILAPLKAYAEMLGIDFDYDAAGKVVTLSKDDDVATIAVGSDKADLNGETVNLTAPVSIVSGTMAAALSDIPELFGGKTVIGEEADHMRSVDITLES